MGRAVDLLSAVVVGVRTAASPARPSGSVDADV
jgi:hypothetical protein